MLRNRMFLSDCRHVVGIDKKVVQTIFDNVRRLQSQAGQAQAKTLWLRGTIEEDATCIRKCPVSVNNKNFVKEIEEWKAKNKTSKKKFKWLNLNIRVGGLVERGQYGKCILHFLPHRLVRPGAVPPTESKEDIASSNLLSRVDGQAKVMSFRSRNPVQSHIMSDGCKAWASACKARKLNHRAVNHAKMQFVKKDMKPAKGQSKLLGTQKIDRLWQDLKGFLGRSVSSKNNAREVNPRLKTYVYAYMFRRNADNVWHETGQLCKG